MADKIRWGIISTANIARGAVIPAIKASRNGVVYAVASRDLARAQTFADELGIEKAYGSYEELLADPNVDAIYNPLPNDGHAPWSSAAAKAKKPTLCEKPLALDAVEAQELVNTFRAEDVLLAEAFMYRYHPQHQMVRELIANQTIGKVTIINAAFTYAMSFDEQDNVRLKPTMGGGGLLDIGCYCVNAIRMMAGEEPDSVSAHATIGQNSGVDEAFVGTLHFPSGVLATFDCGMRGIFRSNYTVVGSEGSLIVTGAFRPDQNPDPCIELRRQNNPTMEIIRIPDVNQYQLMVEDFGDAVREGRKITYDPAESIQNMRVLDALMQAAKDGVVVKL
jgi:xylose dehydrogenase (NAD/NADP)